MGRHLLGQRLHGPARTSVGGLFGHELDQQQHVVVVIDARAPAALEVIEPGQAVLLVALSPHTDLVVMQVDDLADLAIGSPVGGQQHDARPLRHPRFDGARTRPRLENRTVTPAQFQWR